ncbi:TonB family protein [Mucilaginibacter sp. UR6-11]|uniref:TonB family protein n=1 Tax=Mucilaginibacter sp. UR6-11 TaxID=1435644 RepID=UPI001E642D0E|nr:energy transducer TonB [Mucilaginibacter sp. UR6-11]
MVLIIGVLTNTNSSKAATTIVSYKADINQPVTDTVNNDTVFVKVDKEPAFPGGTDAYIKFLSKNIKYPEIMRDRQIENDVNLQFIVEIDGSLSHFKVLNGPGYGTEEEALRVMKLSPKWTPGYKKHRAVRVLFKMPVIFRLKFIEHKPNEDSGFRLINGG